MIYETYNNQIGVKLPFLVSDPDKKAENSINAISYSAYEKRAQRYPELRLRAGGGRDNSVLLAWSHLPEGWKNQLISLFGAPSQRVNPLQNFFQFSADARRFFDGFKFACGTGLTQEQINQYTLNASVLEALTMLKNARTQSRKSRGTSLRGLWDSLLEDTTAFNDILAQQYGVKHTLPRSIKLKKNFRDFHAKGFESIIDGRARNQAARQVTDLMVEIWRDIYAGQGEYKPDCNEVALKYNAFLAGNLEVIQNDTGELYDRENPAFKKVSAKTVYNYLTAWENRVQSHALRSGNRQVFIGDNIPFHKLLPTEYSGTTISVDDRQPPFKNLKGNRIWFYNGIDLGSQAFTVWVHGETKEGIILEFYRQMVRNYVEWGVKLPLELEGELSLNSSFTNSFLAPGAMFENVRIEANNARGKRIEAFFRPLRYQLEKKREGWLARPHAISESNQASAVEAKRIPQEDIVNGCLQDIVTWNNTLHPNQDKYPGKSRWEVFLQNQNPNCKDYNWPGILYGLGKETKTSMNSGRILLQGKHRVVGNAGEVALGEDLIKIMTQIEGKEVTVKWLDGNDGQVIKALVYHNDMLVCELLGDLAYHRSPFERTEQCEINRALTSAYVQTVQAFVNNGKKNISRVTILENEMPQEREHTFTIPGLKKYEANDTAADVLPEPSNEFEDVFKTLSKPRQTSTASRFSNY